MYTLLYILTALACCIGGPILLHRVYERIRADAMDTARVDIGRELTVARSYLSRESEAAIALEAAAQFLRNGEPVDGPKLQRYLRRVKKVKEWSCTH